MQKTNILRYNSMKILTTSSSAQTIKVIPREYITSGTLSLRNDTTNVDKDYSISPSTVDDDLVFTVTFNVSFSSLPFVLLRHAGVTVLISSLFAIFFNHFMSPLIFVLWF